MFQEPWPRRSRGLEGPRHLRKPTGSASLIILGCGYSPDDWRHGSRLPGWLPWDLEMGVSRNKAVEQSRLAKGRGCCSFLGLNVVPRSWTPCVKSCESPDSKMPRTAALCQSSLKKTGQRKLDK